MHIELEEEGMYAVSKFSRLAEDAIVSFSTHEGSDALREATKLDIVDVFCGIGGFSSARGGNPNDDVMLRVWAANTKGVAKLADMSSEWEENSHIEWPSARENLHIHMSPPCTTLSRARTDRRHMQDGLTFLRESLLFIYKQKYTSWTIETVSVPIVKEFLTDFKSTHSLFPMAWSSIDAADYGSPSTRIRIIVANPHLIRNLRQIPVSRISVALAFQQANVPIPAQYIKNNTKTRKHLPCVRHIQNQSHTQTASHPLTWCYQDGTTIRCLNLKETAIIMGFKNCILPNTKRKAIQTTTTRDTYHRRRSINPEC